MTGVITLIRDEYNARKREEYHWYKAHGVCVKCHSANAVSGRTLCASCFEKAKRYREAHAERILDMQRTKVAFRRANGLCLDCGKPNDNGKVRCERCLFRRKKYYALNYGAGG